MSDAVAAPAAPAAPAPAEGGESRAPVTPRLKSEPSAGGITPARGPDGKFASSAAPTDDDPEIDLGDMKLRRSALKSELGRARSASKLLTEAQKAKDEALRIQKAQEERKAAFKSDPRKVIIAEMREQGFSDDEIREHLSTTLFAEFIEPEHLSEEQKRIRELEAKLSEREAREKAEAEKKAKADEERATDEAAQQLEAEIRQAIESGKLPAARAAVRRVASEMAKFEARGQQVHIDLVIAKVRDEVGKETGEFAASASVEDLRELWGPEAFKSHVKKVLDWAMSQARTTNAPKPQPRPALMEQAVGDRKRVSPQDFDKFMKGVR